jgi:hypothetical protein
MHGSYGATKERNDQVMKSVVEKENLQVPICDADENAYDVNAS